MIKLRSILSGISVKILNLIQESLNFADRHVVKLEKANGNREVIEVFLLAERYDEGKFLKVWKTARTLDGEAGSAELSQIK